MVGSEGDRGGGSYVFSTDASWHADCSLVTRDARGRMPSAMRHCAAVGKIRKNDAEGGGGGVAPGVEGEGGGGG